MDDREPEPEDPADVRTSRCYSALNRAVHTGYCQFYRRRGQTPPQVSLSVIEEPEAFYAFASQVDD